MAIRRLAVWAVALVLSAPAGAQQLQLQSRQTDNLDLVYYDQAHEYLSYHLTRAFENSLAFQRRLFDYTPSEPVVVLMQDFGDYGHGGTSTVPWNYVSIGIEPFDYVYETMPANERINWLMHHELVHVVATDKGADQDLFFRRIFRGKVSPIKENPLSMFYSFLTSPRWYSPRWYHEGIAVFLETWMAGGLGRVLGGYDEMAFRTMVLENAYFYDIVGLESEGTTIDFQVGQNAYLYGTRFVTYLSVQHGPEKVVQWFNRTAGSKRYFSAQFRSVFGVPLEQEWRRWIAWEGDWQRENLDRIRQYPVSEGRRINAETLGSVSRSFYDQDRKLLYVAINRPARPAQIVAINVESGAMSRLADVGTPALFFVTSMAYDAKGRKIFFTTDNARGWRDLHQLDLATGRRRMLIKDSRTGDLVVNPANQSIWGVQHHNGFSSLVLIPPPYNGWKTILTLDYGRDIYDLDISPDGSALSGTVTDIGGRHELVRLDIARLLAGDSTFEVLHQFENTSPANFVFSGDGRYLFGSSYYTGVSNIFRYDLQEKKMEALSNAESGLFRPIPISDDTLIAYRYTATGFVPVFLPIAVREDLNAIRYLGQQVVEKHPIVKSWNAGSPARVNLDQVTTYAGPYRSLARLRLGSMYPVLEGYKDSVAAGLRLNFADPLGLNTVDVTAAWSPDDALDDDERLHLSVGYSGAPWKVRLNYNATDFYDLFGPTRTSRKGYSGSVAYHQYLVFERPRTLEYTISGAFYGGLDTLPEYQNVRAPFEEYATAGAHLDFQDLRRTLGAVDYEFGTRWSAAASANHVSSETFPRLWATYDRGVLLPLEHSSLWLRAAAGKSFGDRDNPFANFFFGGFGNNWVDYREVRRYRDYYSFPGLELNEVGGNDFAKATLEWTLPPIRFQRLGVPGFYANWSRPALFWSGLVTDMGKDELRREIQSIGAQIDLSLVVFSSLESMLSAGYAVAFENGRSSGEVMVSLNLLR